MKNKSSLQGKFARDVCWQINRDYLAGNQGDSSVAMRSGQWIVISLFFMNAKWDLN
jgi:hypothetical protein